MSGVVVKWFDMIYSPREEAFRETKLVEALSEENRRRVKRAANDERCLIRAQLTEYLYDSMAKVIIEHIFSIIVG